MLEKLLTLVVTALIGFGVQVCALGFSFIEILFFKYEGRFLQPSAMCLCFTIKVTYLNRKRN